jgi:hypothetical protein
MFDVDKVVRNALGHGKPMLMRDKVSLNNKKRTF